MFAPGAGWSYSNTGYIVLGLIVETASGNSMETELDGRIFGPLHLRGTSFDTSPRIAGTYAHGYSDPDALNLPRDDSRPQDVSVFSQSSAWAAGAIVSTADDLANFYRALLRGRLLRPGLLRAMETTFPVAGDPRGGRSGLGLFEAGLPCGRVWGHEGTSYGYKTVAYSSRDATRQIVVMVNDSPPSPVVANEWSAWSTPHTAAADPRADKLDGRVRRVLMAPKWFRHGLQLMPSSPVASASFSASRTQVDQKLTTCASSCPPEQPRG